MQYRDGDAAAIFKEDLRDDWFALAEGWTMPSSRIIGWYCKNPNLETLARFLHEFRSQYVRV
jgi:hypothetical protein